MRLNSVKARMTLGSIGLIGMIAAVGYVGYWAIHRVDAHVSALSRNILPAMRALARVGHASAVALAESRALELAALAQDGEKARKAAEARTAALQRADEATKDLEQRLGSAAGSALARVHGVLGEWRTHCEDVLGALVAKEWARARVLAAASEGYAKKVGDELAGLATAHDERATGAEAAATATVATAERMQTIALIVALIGALAMTILITRSITRPLSRLREAAARIAVGDVSQKVEHRANDEVGDLAEAFRQLIAYLEAMAATATSIASGDLSSTPAPRSDADVLALRFASMRASLSGLVDEMSALSQSARAGELGRRADAKRWAGAYAMLVSRTNEMLDALRSPVQEAIATLERVAKRDLRARARGQYAGEHARLAEALNVAVGNLDEGFSRVSLATAEVRGASAQIAEASQSLSTGASEQASSVAESAASLGEMTALTQRTAESARSADSLAREASGASDRGAAAMKQMLGAMGKIRGAAESTAGIIRDINDIAFQTNLLALNAAVEAARAGDAGRGFAVVAEEVRGLAMRAKDAAKKTESLIAESVRLAGEGESLSQDVSRSLDAIVERVGEVTGIVSRIAEASGEQSRGIEKTSAAVVRIDQVTQTNAAGAEELSSTAEELSAQAEELAGLVSGFELSGAGGAEGKRHAAAERLAPHAAPRIAAASRASAANAANAPRRAAAVGHADPLPMGDDAFNDF